MSVAVGSKDIPNPFQLGYVTKVDIRRCIGTALSRERQTMVALAGLVCEIIE